MTHSIQISASAEKFLTKLRDQQLKCRLWNAIKLLAHDPHPPGSIKMEGGISRYRIRIGDYRVIYQIEGDKTIILVLAVGHRREIYR